MILLNKTVTVFSPVSGMCLNLKEGINSLFSNRHLGEGVLIRGSDDLISSPVNGTVSFVSPFKDSIIVNAYEKFNLLIHLDSGIFNNDLITKENDKLRVNDPIFKIYDTMDILYNLSIVILDSHLIRKLKFLNLGNDISVGDNLMIVNI